MLLRARLIFLSLISVLVSLSQNYPVQLSAQLQPPFSGYLSDYASPGNQSLRIFILFTDFTKPTYNVKLKFKLTGQGITIQSKSYYYAGPFTLEPGIPLEFSGSDLAGLLNSNNLDFSGISKYQYEQGKVLPEGYYQLCVTAYDFNNPTEIQVSNESCAFAWMVLNDSPYLNLPLCGGAVQAFNPQNVIFQWTPMNLASPNSAFNTQYEFSLYQVQGPGNTPANVLQTLPPIYQYTTHLTTFNYGITEPVLYTGSQYVWRVKAIDMSGRDLFKNNGYSQYCTFTYGNLTQLLDSNSLRLTLHGAPVTHRLGKFYWDSLGVFKTYKLRYRKKGTLAWFDDGELGRTYNFVPNLEPGTDYEGQVRGKSGDGSEGPWSNVVTIHTPDKPVVVCGQPNSLLLQNFKPLAKASKGMIWEIGQFEMAVTGLYNAEHPGGIYSGYGRIEIPFLLNMQMNCKFSNVVVNEEMQIVAGEVSVITEGIDAWMSHFQYPAGWNQVDTIKTNGSINSVTTSGGQIFVNGSSVGNSGQNTVITGTNGTTYYVSSNGTVTQESYPHATPVGNISALRDSLATVDFSSHAETIYALDCKALSSQTGGEEKDYEVLPQGKDKYYVAYKLLVTGTEDKIKAKVTGSNKLKAGSLLFKRSDGTIIPFSLAGSDEYEINLKGRLHLYQDALWAFAKSSNLSDTNYYPVGKINLVSIDKRINTVVLVPVNGYGQNADATAIQNDLNSIYKKAGVEWQVNKENNLVVTGYTGDSLLRVNRSWLNTGYGSDLKNIITQYKAQNNGFSSSASYVFLCNKAANNELGYMALNKQFGFVFMNGNSNVARTLAHELGHGAFVLEHAFPSGNSGNTQNLMDYNNGTLFNHRQWICIHDPEYVKNIIGTLVQDDESGLLCTPSTASRITIYETLKQIKFCYAKNISYPVSQLPVGSQKQLVMYDAKLGSTKFPYLKIFNNDPQKTSVIPTNRISAELKTLNGSEGYGLVKVDNAIYIEVPPNYEGLLKTYLTTPDSKNLLLFVNGYRTVETSLPVDLKVDHLTEIIRCDNPNSMNKVHSGDIYDYWMGIDQQFMDRIGTTQAVYADGHHDITTSNHNISGSITLSKTGFINNILMCNTAKTNAAPPPPSEILHTKANASGFQLRKSNGMTAGRDLLQKINSGFINFNKQIDTLDIVAHSMGYAYAIGMIEVLKAANINFGRFYIIAPENGCSGGVEWNRFTEVWQYGSDLGQPGADPVWEQDGVAPQCECTGLGSADGQTIFGTSGKKLKAGRVFIPKSFSPKGFVESHSIGSYGWIFNKINPGERGYVKKRN